MARSAFRSVHEYIAAQPQATQVVLKLVRKTIRKALPGAEEAISYNIPAYKLRGRAVLYFAGWRRHYSLYPVSAPLVGAFKDELATYKVNKGTIRFPLSAPVPVKLIERIAKYRAKELRGKEAASEGRGNPKSENAPAPA
jgi:uncharacterized protein YdhG (YjbR/CyaY superfamily)